MATLSAGKLTNLRTTKHSSKFYLSVLKPTALLAARVNNGSISRGARSIAYDTGTGTGFSTIAAGQTLWVGTTAGDNDAGIVRIKSVTGSQSSGTLTVAENGIDWVDNLHLTVKHNYEIHAIAPRIDAGVFYKDYDITWSNHTTQPEPVTIGGPHQAGFLSGGSLVLNVPVGNSYAIASGASISSRSVTVSPSAGVTVGAYSAPNIPVTYTAAGTYWVKASTTDSNGKTQITYRVHFVYDSSTLPYNDFDVSGVQGDWQSGGWTFNVTVYGSAALSDFPDGTLVLLWREGRFDNTAGYANVWDIGDNVVCCGYIRNDSQQQDFTSGAGQVSFQVATPEAVMAARTEMGSVSVEAAASPAAWWQYASWLTVGRGVHHLLKWHSTVLETCDVFGLLDNTLGVEVAEFNEDSLYSRVNGFAYSRGIFAKLISDRLGRLHLSEDIQMFNETNRGAEDTVMSITQQDLGGQAQITRESDFQNALAFADGFSFNGTTSTPLISIAGGYIDGSAVSIQVPEPSGTGTINLPRQVFTDQTDSNEKTGRALAAGNNRLKDIRVPFRADYLAALDIDPQLGWYAWGVSNSELKRNLSLNGKNLLCRRVQGQIDVAQGQILTDAIFEAEAFGPDGIPGNYPTGYPTITLPSPNWTIPEDAAAFYGYFAGGITGSSQVATAYNILFSTGVTSANTDSDLSQARDGLGGVSDTINYGYFAGGYTGSLNTTRVVTADRITFSTGVTAANTDSDLSQARKWVASLSDGSTYGYILGGYSGSAVTTADRITFSTGITAANTDSNTTSIRYGTGGVSDASTYGYISDYFTGSPVANRITFSTGVTAANTDSNLSQARDFVTALSDGSTYGYFAGGETVGVYLTTADRITFSTGVTAANTDSNLSQARRLLAAVADGDTYGYFAGGETSGGTSEVVTADRITFSTGVTAANTDSDLPAATQSLAAVSDGAV